MPVNDTGEHDFSSLVLYRALFENAADTILLVENEVIRDCNHAATILFGRPREQICGRPVPEFSPEFQPDGNPSIQKARAHFAAALAGETQSFEWHLLRADGTPFPVEIALNRVPVQDQALLQASVRDITLRKLDEEELMDAYKRISAAESEIRQQYAALAETEEMFRNPVEQSPAGIYLRQDGIIRYANPRFATMFGYERDEVLGKQFTGIVDPGHRMVESPAPDNPPAGTPCLRRLEFSGRRRDGSVIELEILEAPMEYKGRPALYGNLLDTTLRKQAEATIHALLNATRDETVLTDNEGRILAVNEAFARSAGKLKQALIGTVIYELIASGGISMKMADEMQNKGSGVPVSFAEELGGRWFDTTIYSVNDSQGVRQQVAIFRHDITSLKAAERDLRAANEQLVSEKERLALFAAALDNMRDLAVITRGMGEILYINVTFAQKFGCKIEDVAGKKLKELAHNENLFEIGDSFFIDYRETDRQGLFIGRNQYGVKIPLTITARPILYYNRKPTHFVFVMREKIG